MHKSRVQSSRWLTHRFFTRDKNFPVFNWPLGLISAITRFFKESTKGPELSRESNHEREQHTHSEDEKSERLTLTSTMNK